MENSTAYYSILTFPQEFNRGILRLNLVVLPRNFSPLIELEFDAPLPNAASFAESHGNLKIDIKLIAGLNQIPVAPHSWSVRASGLTVPDSAPLLFAELGSMFDIVDNPGPSFKAPPPASSKYIKKYLPFSYRQSFNFTNPRTRDAVIDDSYFCAFKDADGPQDNFQQSSNQISWGKVYAYCLRNPELAKKVGLIYTDIIVEVQEDSLLDGGWLYADLAETGYFFEQAQDDPSRVKRYAARIPPMENDDQRILFAPVLFPVSFDGSPRDGNYDEHQREAADYDDGFCKIIHGFQPISTNYLKEEPDEDMLFPTKDIGIRLAWDDEQILIWQNRQLKPDASVGPNQRLDAPLGVFNYRVDVREKLDGTNAWHSLNRVVAKGPLTLGGQRISDDGDELELGTEVYPVQIDGNKNRNFWLPAYFAQWSGKSLVLPDKDAHTIFRQHENEETYEDALGVQRSRSVRLGDLYEPLGLDAIPLAYGITYEFRIRMGDISGGGPKHSDSRISESISKNTSIHFRRFVPPNAVRMEGLPNQNDFFEDDQLVIRRPLLGYPNIEFADKYDRVVEKLIAYSNIEYTDYRNRKNVPIGLPDPDVTKVEVIVEIKGLQLDNQLSVSGNEPYYKLYSVTRSFPDLDVQADLVTTQNVEDPFANIEIPLQLPINFVDAHVLLFDDPANLGDLGFSQPQLQNRTDIVLPTARDIRITLKAIGKNDGAYFGLDAWNQGKTIQFLIRKGSDDETTLFDPNFAEDRIEGIYLQPDNVPSNKASRFNRGVQVNKPSSPIQRLAQQINVESRGLSLLAQKGTRVQFGCSRRIRHSLAPDGTALTISTKSDLIDHWLVPLHFRLQRDWTWDATKLEGFVIKRAVKFGRNPAWSEEKVIGSLDLHRTINLQALTSPNRTYTQLVFLDAVEPKNDPGIDFFPDIINLRYSIEPIFKDQEVPGVTDEIIQLELPLPVTTIPSQIPMVASAGLALSPYRKDERYANTEPRRQHLWIELKEAVEDPNDAVFIRFLANAPDPLLADLVKYPELIDEPEESAIPLDPELIRVIRPEQADDFAGLNAMTELIPAITTPGEAPRHFLVPLPPGLHAESDELFGFFTYELRMGHRRIWSTAQGRFGRPLRVTGVQHPVPTLFCTVERKRNEIVVSAPYASAVHNGKEVTASPPRTELWCLIYAQVKRADNQSYQNILIGEDKLTIPEPEDPVYGIDGFIRATGVANNTTGSFVARPPLNIDDFGFQSSLDLDGREDLPTFIRKTSNEETRVYGRAKLSIADINSALTSFGLHQNATLSVLCVEFLPTNYHSYITENQEILHERLEQRKEFPPISRKFKMVGSPSPLSLHLGQYRILRTSPLRAVPDKC